METTDETVIYRTGVHWIVLVVPVFIFLFIGGIGIFFIAGAIEGLLLKQLMSVQLYSAESFTSCPAVLCCGAVFGR